MPYCGKNDILQEISEEELTALTDDEGAGIVNDNRVLAAIAKADALIDSYCGQVASVPFPEPPPAIIKQHSITIAIYYLFSRRGVAPEIRRTNYEDAVANLKDIAAGKASLPPTTEADYKDQIKVSGPTDEATGEGRLFTKDKMGSY